MLLEECTTFSVWQRKTVPTIKVHPPADDTPSSLTQTRLQEVIDSAPHYSKVLILGGSYNEQLMISKAIEICGEDGDEPIISSRGPTITVNSDVPCFFASLKIKTKSISTSSTRSDPPAISMSTGKAVFFRCEMTSIYVCGTAQPVIERCLIQGNGGGSGLVVRDSAGGSYLTNEITDHSMYCLEVLSRGKPKFVNNDIHTSSDDPNVNPGIGLLRISGGGAGALSLAIHGEVAPTFIGNKFQDSFSDEQRNNAQAVFGSDTKKMFFAPEISTQRVALAIEYANPTFKNNSVDGGVVAMSIVGGTGTYTSNTVQLSMLCGVFVSRGAQTKFENNKFTQHGGGGLYIDGCSPTILACNIVQCRGVGISVNNSKDFSLSSCLIEKNRVGVSILGTSGGTVKENQIQRNELIGLRTSDLGVKTLITDNLIQMNGGCGVYILAGAMPRLTRNTVHSQKAGLVATSGSFPTVIDNHIYGNEQFAVSVQERTRGVFQKNKFANGIIAAVKVTDHSMPLFEENKIDEATVGIFVSSQASGRFINNSLRGHGDGVHLSTFADPFLDGNHFQNCSRYGAFCLEDALGTITNNTFTNTMIGVGCFKGAQTLFRANTIEAAMHVGGVLGEESRAVLEKNTFTDSKGHGLVLTGYLSKSRVRKCNFHNSQGYGVLSEKQSSGIVEWCFFSGNNQAGFGSEEEGESLFRNNRSLEDIGPGMMCTNNGGGTFLRNVVEEGRTVGCKIDGNGRPHVQHCSFLRCFAAGILLEEGAEGEISDCIADGNRIGLSMKGVGCKTKVLRTTVTHSTDVGISLGAAIQASIVDCKVEDQPVGARLQNCGPATLDACSISRCGKGVVCEKGGQAVLNKCTIQQSATCFMELSDGGHLTARECTMSGCSGNGIITRSKCKGLFVETKVTGCKDIGVLIESHAEPKFELCTIAENSVGVHSRDNASGHLADTSIIENATTNVVCRQRSVTAFHKCIIAVCKGGPGVICGGDNSKFTDCQIQRNATHGFLLESGSRVAVRGCTVLHNKMSGLYCLPRSEPTSTGCKVVENDHSGVVIAGGAMPNMSENEVVDNADGGVLCLTGSMGTLQKNIIKGNHLCNVRALHQSKTTFLGNTITSGKDVGVIVQGSACRFDGNTMSHHNHAAVYIAGPSNIELEHNTITHNSNGIVFEAAGVNQFRNPLGIDRSQNNTDEAQDTFVFRNQPTSPRNAPQQHATAGNHAATHSGATAAAAAPLGSSATVTENTFSHNNLCAVVLARKSVATLTQNNFHDGEVGVKIHTQALGSVENNTFSTHKVAAIQIFGNLIETKIRLNTFEKNEIGIEIRHNNKTSTFAAGKGWTPSQHALGAKAEANLTPGSNALKVRKKKTLLDSVAIMFAAGTDHAVIHANRASFDDPLEQSERRVSLNDAETDSLGGSSFDDGSSNSSDDSDESHATSSRYRRKKLAASKLPAAVSKHRITTVVIKNKFIDNLKYGIFALEGSETQIISNEFQGELCGVGGGSGSSVHILDNTFAKCCVGVHLATDTNFQVIRNQFTDANELGVYSSGGTGNILRNVFSLCIVAGVCVEQTGAPTVSRNLFAFNVSTELSAGIFTRRGGGGFFSDNDIHENSIGIRCDNGGLGTFSNCFVHDNTLGLHAMSSGKCTISQTFFTQNKIADVYSSHGGAPILNRCVLYDSPKPFLIRDFGGGIFSFNVMKNVDGSAVLIQFPPMAVHDARVAAIAARKKKDLHDSAQLLRMVLNMDDTISRAGVAMLSVVELKTLNTVYRVSPTFSSNLIVNCGAGIEIDLGDAPKDRLLAKMKRGPQEAEGAPKPGGKLGRQKSTLSSVASAASLKASRAGADEEDANGNVNQTRKSKAEQQARYVSPLPDLQTLSRGDYWAFFTQNVVQQCITGILVHKGAVDRPPKFRPLYDSTANQQGATTGGVDDGKETYSGPSMEEFDNDSDPKTATLMTDDVFMVHFDGNTIFNDDVGITIRHGGNARFERNYVMKCMRAGILVTDEGRGEFFENVVTDCTSGYALNVLGDTMRTAVSSSILPCYANFQANVFSNSKTCATISAPEVRMTKNRFYGGEQGLMVYPAAGGLFQLNIIYENRRVGCVCMSESAILTANWFYSPQENSAIEMQMDSSSAVGNRIPPGNAVKNQFTPRLAKPEPANKISLTSDHVSETKSAKDQRDLFHVLREMHDAQLPSCGATGCNRIGVYASKDQLEAFVQAKRRVMATKVVVTENGLLREPPKDPSAASQRGGLASTTDASSRGIQFHEPPGKGHAQPQSSTNAAQSTSFGSTSVQGVDAADGQSMFGGLSAQNNHLTGTMFRASSSRFGRQTEGGLAPAGSQRIKSIVTMEEMRQELRKKREDREQSKNGGAEDAPPKRRRSSVASAKRRKSSAAARRRSTVSSSDAETQRAVSPLVSPSNKLPQTKAGNTVSPVLTALTKPRAVSPKNLASVAASPSAWAEGEEPTEIPGGMLSTSDREDASLLLDPLRSGSQSVKLPEVYSRKSSAQFVELASPPGDATFMNASGPTDAASMSPSGPTDSNLLKKSPSTLTPRSGANSISGRERRQSAPRQALVMTPRASVPTTSLEPPPTSGSDAEAGKDALRVSPPPAPPQSSAIDVGVLSLRSAAASPTSAAKLSAHDRMKALDASFGGGSSQLGGGNTDEQLGASMRSSPRLVAAATAVMASLALDSRKQSPPPPPAAVAPSGGREAAAKKIKEAMESRKQSLAGSIGMQNTTLAGTKPQNTPTFRMAPAAAPTEKWSMNRGVSNKQLRTAAYPSKALSSGVPSAPFDAEATLLNQPSSPKEKTPPVVTYGVLETAEAPNFTVAAAAPRNTANEQNSPSGSPTARSSRRQSRSMSHAEPSAVLEASGSTNVVTEPAPEPVDEVPPASLVLESPSLKLPTAALAAAQASPPPPLAADTPLLGLPSPPPSLQAGLPAVGATDRRAEDTTPAPLILREGFVNDDEALIPLPSAHIPKLAQQPNVKVAGRPPIVVKPSSTVTPPPLTAPLIPKASSTPPKPSLSPPRRPTSRPPSVPTHNDRPAMAPAAQQPTRRAASGGIVPSAAASSGQIIGKVAARAGSAQVVTEFAMSLSRGQTENAAIPIANAQSRPPTGGTQQHYHIHDLQFQDSDDDVMDHVWFQEQQQKRRGAAPSAQRRVPQAERSGLAQTARRPPLGNGLLQIDRRASDATELALSSFPGNLVRVSADSPRGPPAVGSRATFFPATYSGRSMTAATSSATLTTGRDTALQVRSPGITALRVSPSRRATTSPPKQPAVSRPPVYRHMMDDEESQKPTDEPLVVAARKTSPPVAKPNSKSTEARSVEALSPVVRMHQYRRPAGDNDLAVFPALNISTLGGTSSAAVALSLVAGVGDDALVLTGRGGGGDVMSPRPPLFPPQPRTVTIQSHKDEAPQLHISGLQASTSTSSKGHSTKQPSVKYNSALLGDPEEALLLDGVGINVPIAATSPQLRSAPQIPAFGNASPSAPSPRVQLPSPPQLKPVDPAIPALPLVALSKSRPVGVTSPPGSTTAPSRREHIIFGDVDDMQPRSVTVTSPPPGHNTSGRRSGTGDGSRVGSALPIPGSARVRSSSSSTPSTYQHLLTTVEGTASPRVDVNSLLARPTSGLPGTFVQRGSSSTFVPYTS